VEDSPGVTRWGQGGVPPPALGVWGRPEGPQGRGRRFAGAGRNVV